MYAGKCRSISVAVKIIKGFDPKSKDQFIKEAQRKRCSLLRQLFVLTSHRLQYCQQFM